MWKGTKSGDGYKKISKALSIPRSTVNTIIKKWLSRMAPPRPCIDQAVSPSWMIGEGRD